MLVNVVVAGCCGRMGQAISRCALSQEGVGLGAVFEAKGHPAIGQEYGAILGVPVPGGLRVGDDARHAIGSGQVLIEFTSPEATVEHARLAQERRTPMVIGTTGLSDAQQDALRAVSTMIPLVVSPNMSLGVNVLFELAALAATRLRGYDVEVIESHHRQKKDAPSGTAKRLVAVLADARGPRAGDPAIAPRPSAMGGQGVQQPVGGQDVAPIGGNVLVPRALPVGLHIPVHAVRAGDIVGDHTVLLAGGAERLELTHRAHSREVFAQGALRAAQFVVTQPPGFYDMSDVLQADST